MGIFNRKKEEIIKDYQAETVDGAEVWMVSWDARFGEYRGDSKRVAKAFFSETDAEAFKQSLEEAQKLLQYKENIHISVDKQE